SSQIRFGAATLEQSLRVPSPERPMRLVPLLVLIASSAGAQTFIVRRGTDTVAIERFTRDKGTLTGEVVQPNGPRTRYVMTLKADNSVDHLDVTRTGRQGNQTTISADVNEKNVKATIGAQG